MPSQAKQLSAAFRAEVWLIHITAPLEIALRSATDGFAQKVAGLREMNKKEFYREAVMSQSPGVAALRGYPGKRITKIVPTPTGL
jgi:hypothetical protein